MSKSICEKCYEIVDSLFWSHKDQLICRNCELGQTIETEYTPEKQEMLRRQHEEFVKWRKENGN